MKTVEEILIEFGCPNVPFDENVTMYYPAILSAMEEYANAKVDEAMHKSCTKINSKQNDSARIDLEQLSRLLAYSDKYEISIQFWPKQIAVYIAKDGVNLQDYGGDFDFAIGRSIEYLDRVTGNYR